MKRTQVNFPEEQRPKLISPSIRQHNLTEVYNQCATIERLMDALEWAAHELPDYQVIRCHPSTSSDSSDENTSPDNDLILQNAVGEAARFEVSDVANSESDSNKKQDKDLRSLGVLSSPKGEARYQIDQFPAGRLFLVVSTEFAHRLQKRNLLYLQKKRHFRYQEYPISEGTVIFEVLPAGL